MQDIKEYLRSYIPALKYAELCFRELDSLEDVSIQSPKMDGMPRTSSLHGVEDQVARIDAIRRKAEKARERVLTMLEDIEMRIDALENDDQRLVIKMRYIYGCRWDEIATGANMSQRSVYYVHGKALAEMRKNDAQRANGLARSAGEQFGKGREGKKGYRSGCAASVGTQDC